MIIEINNKNLWGKTIEKVKNADIFYTHNFAKFNGNTKLFIFETGKDYSIFPFKVEQNIIISQRYGGMICSKFKKKFINQSVSSLIGYCKINRLKKIIIRNHPFTRTIKIGNIIRKEPFVYVDLKKSEMSLFYGISPEHRKSISIAKRENLLISESREIKFLLCFYEFYKDLMIRKGIEPLRKTYFNRLYACLKDNLSFVYARDRLGTIAVSLLLKSKQNIFMLYGSMNARGYKKCAKHLMIYELMLKYKNKGFNRLALGTGVDGKEDSIYRFKQGFSNIKSYIYTYGYQL